MPAWRRAANCDRPSLPDSTSTKARDVHAIPTPAAAQTESSLTAYVADFVVATRAQDIPPDVAHLGKRSVLDGLGLALAGAVSETAHIAQRYLASLGMTNEGGSTEEPCDDPSSNQCEDPTDDSFANGKSITDHNGLNELKLAIARMQQKKGASVFQESDEVFA